MLQLAGVRFPLQGVSGFRYRGVRFPLQGSPCLLSVLLSVVTNIEAWGMAMEPIRRRNDDAFWQRLVLPEEERRRIRDWEGGYRWFRSASLNATSRIASANATSGGPVGLPGNRIRELLVESELTGT